jgi:hypothetical protein
MYYQIQFANILFKISAIIYIQNIFSVVFLLWLYAVVVLWQYWPHGISLGVLPPLQLFKGV